MSALIQGQKIQTNVSSIDFNSNCTNFAIGGRESIMIFGLRLQNKCWLDCQKKISKYKGTNITRTCVSQLAWNKYGTDYLAIGTTSGYVLVYQANNPYKNIMQVKGHEGNINNIQWNASSMFNFVSSSFQNYINQWDFRAEKPQAKYEFSQTTKIRDLKFSPHNPYLLAVQSTTKIEISDIRNQKNKILLTYQIHDNQLQGIGVQWDPNHDNKIASAISKEINIFDIKGDKLELSDTLSHYSLVKSFYWMKNKENHFGVLGQHPEKNIFFYDLEDKHRISYMYGGHGRSIDCWKMNSDQSILLSASNIRVQNARNAGAGASSWGLLVTQYTDNYYDPNESKYNYPITFDNNNNIAFCLNNEQSPKKSILSMLNRKKSTKAKQTSPLIYSFTDSIQWQERSIKINTIQEEFLYLHKNYIIYVQNSKQYKNQQISQHNYEIAKKIGKQLCAQIWKNLFSIAFPYPIQPAQNSQTSQEELHTIDSIYEQKLKLDIEIVQNRVVLFNKQQKYKKSIKINLVQMLQQLVDQNQLQTAVLASICLINKNPEIIPKEFIHSIFATYMELLHNFQMYDIAASTILLLKQSSLTNNMKDTTFMISCGLCKESISKGNCKCNKLCVICEGSLSERMVIWCKYCGHGGHAVQYQQWFKVDKKPFCPHECGHACFTPDDF